MPPVAYSRTEPPDRSPGRWIMEYPVMSETDAYLGLHGLPWTQCCPGLHTENGIHSSDFKSRKSPDPLSRAHFVPYFDETARI